MPMQEPILVEIDPAAEALGVSRSTLLRLLGDGTIKSVQIRRRRLIERSELERYVADLRVGS